MPQDETSIDVNPTVDELRRRCERLPARLGHVRLLRRPPTTASTGTTGSCRSRRCRAATTSTAAAIRRSPSTASGVVYYAQINFNRTDDTSGVWVNRSTNGGFTWSRPCVADPGRASAERPVPLRRPGDPRQPGDGTVAFQQDNDTSLNGSVPANDKEYITAGPRPAGVEPVASTPIAHTATTCTPRTPSASTALYVTYSLFSGNGRPQILLSYSDDQARSWSRAEGDQRRRRRSAAADASPACDDNQGSTPTVNPTTGRSESVP